MVATRVRASVLRSFGLGNGGAVVSGICRNPSMTEKWT
jgi:hypothetical protein